ncbi:MULTISPECIES: GntR family transcriptional regulator [Streptomyces]|nr:MULTISPECIES: GntR family transcriptional regulator [Streptomyces]
MGPKSERVYRTIREWIARGKYSLGSKLPSERTLSEDLEKLTGP